MHPNPSSIRQWSISISIALVAICVLIVTTILLIRALQVPEDKPSLPYANNVLSPPRPALSFELSNQHGATISLPSFESTPVLITFLYTQCAKACPITTGKLNQLKRLLDANDIGMEIVAIYVDPQGDSVTSAYEYSKKWKMENEWHYLTGSVDELSPLWQYYWAEPIYHPESGVSTPPPAKELLQLEDGITPAQNYISHSPPVFVIRNQEILLAMSNANFDPNLLLEYLRSLS